MSSILWEIKYQSIGELIDQVLIQRRIITFSQSSQLSEISSPITDDIQITEADLEEWQNFNRRTF